MVLSSFVWDLLFWSLLLGDRTWERGAAPCQQPRWAGQQGAGGRGQHCKGLCCTHWQAACLPPSVGPSHLLLSNAHPRSHLISSSLPNIPTHPAPTLPTHQVQMADIPDVDLSKVGVHKFGSFEVEVVDNTADYFATLKVSQGGEKK